MRKLLHFLLIILILILSAYIIYSLVYKDNDYPTPPEPNTNTSTQLPYEPTIDPQKFTTNITNQFFSQPIGRELTYEGESLLEKRSLITNLLDSTNTILGVSTLEYLEEYFVNDEIAEEVRSQIAQDDEGNVWIFGQERIVYPEDGDSARETKWVAGEEGAKAGILIKGSQFVGDSYRMMYQQGKFEWIRDVTEMGVALTVMGDEYTDCVRMFDWTPLSDTDRFYKYYCSDVSNLVRVVDIENEQVYELVDLTAL